MNYLIYENKSSFEMPIKPRKSQENGNEKEQWA